MSCFDPEIVVFGFWTVCFFSFGNRVSLYVEITA
jgi:hypothetical protein